MGALDNEIEMLEKKLGFKGDGKNKAKLYKDKNETGLGIGFMEFLDQIDTYKTGSKAKDFSKKEYDFNDSDQEVAISEGALGSDH